MKLDADAQHVIQTCRVDSVGAVSNRTGTFVVQAADTGGIT